MITTINEFRKIFEYNSIKETKNSSKEEWKQKLGSVKFENTQDNKTTLAYNDNFDIVGKWFKDKNEGEIYEKPTEKYDMYF